MIEKARENSVLEAAISRGTCGQKFRKVISKSENSLEKFSGREKRERSHENNHGLRNLQWRTSIELQDSNPIFSYRGQKLRSHL